MSKAPPELSIDEVGLYLAEAVQLMGTLEAIGAHQRAPSAALPSGAINCGEACRLVPAVIALSLHIYPQLADAGVLESIIRYSLTRSATGAVQ